MAAQQQRSSCSSRPHPRRHLSVFGAAAAVALLLLQAALVQPSQAGQDSDLEVAAPGRTSRITRKSHHHSQSEAQQQHLMAIGQQLATTRHSALPFSSSSSAVGSSSLGSAPLPGFVAEVLGKPAASPTDSKSSSLLSLLDSGDGKCECGFVRGNAQKGRLGYYFCSKVAGVDWATECTNGYWHVEDEKNLEDKAAKGEACKSACRQREAPAPAPAAPKKMYARAVLPGHHASQYTIETLPGGDQRVRITKRAWVEYGFTSSNWMDFPAKTYVVKPNHGAVARTGNVYYSPVYHASADIERVHGDQGRELPSAYTRFGVRTEGGVEHYAFGVGNQWPFALQEEA